MLAEFHVEAIEAFIFSDWPSNSVVKMIVAH